MTLLQKFQDPHHLQYSPIAFGSAFLGSSLIGVVVLAYKALNISVFLYSIALLLAVGIALQFKSNRVLYIRIYQMITIAMLAAVYLIAATVVLADGQPLWKQWLIAIILFSISVGLGIHFFFRTRRSYTPTMPHGPLGTLNPKTGVVDPTKSPPKLQRQLDKSANKTNLVWRLTPLTAGLALAFVHGLSNSGAELLMAIIAVVVVMGVSGAIGSTLAYIAAILRWERKHDKQITVKR